MVSEPLFADGRVRPLKRVEYDKLVELGVFEEDEKLELLRGFIVRMNPQGSPDAYVVRKLNKALMTAVGERAEVSPQCPFAALDDSEPEPDLALVPPTTPDAHPSSAYLLIEVAASSLRLDRGVKLEIYAEAKVPEYWIVDVTKRVVEVYRDPNGSEYATKSTHKRGDVIELVALAGVRIDTSTFLPE